MEVPTDLIYHIFSYDYDLLCKLNFPIRKEHRTKGLLTHCVKNGYNNILIKYFNPEWTFSLFELSIYYNNLEAVKFMYSFLNKQDLDYIPEFISYSIQHKYYSIVFFLLEKKDIDVTWDVCKLLEDAVFSGNPSILEMLLNHPNMSDIYGYNNSAFVQAIYCEDYKMINCFLNCDKIEIDSYAISAAIDMGNNDLINYFYDI